MPLPIKIRRIDPGCQAPIAAAPGAPTPVAPTLAAAGPTNAAGPTGSPVLTAATGLTVRADPPNSRRAAANADHANGAAAGPSPVPPPASHANTPEPRPWTDPDAAARGAVDITGATTGAVGDAAAGDAADEPDSQPATTASTASTASTGSETTAPAMSSDVADDGRPRCGPTRVESTPADTTTPARR